MVTLQTATPSEQSKTKKDYRLRFHVRHSRKGRTVVIESSSLVAGAGRRNCRGAQVTFGGGRYFH